MIPLQEKPEIIRTSFRNSKDLVQNSGSFERVFISENKISGNQQISRNSEMTQKQYLDKNNIEQNLDFQRKESQQSLNPLRGYTSINQQIKERLEGIFP